MELAEGIRARRSIRSFRQEQVPRDILERVLELSSRAISSNNSQPWEYIVVTGEPLEKLRAYNVRALSLGWPADRDEATYPAICRARGKQNGRRLFEAMGIARDDWAKRAWWVERGYRFFDAPAVIFLAMDRQFDEKAFRFDLGCVTQNLCLAALEYGLGTCVEQQAITYQQGIYQILGIPENKYLAYGIAIGYPDWSFPANQVISQREPVQAVTQWYGF